MDTLKQARKREAAIRRIIAALIAGRHLSLKNSHEFEVAEMHTVFCYIRKKINAGQIVGYVMRDVWRTDENSIRYKEYWFENESGQN